MKYCPCNKEKRYLECCGMYLQKKLIPPTPEALMRSRYTAYVEGKLDYIRRTMRGQARLNFDKRNIMKKPQEWLGLQVVRSFNDASNVHVGYVEFIATYKLDREIYEIHEISEFHLIEDRWYYVAGESGGKE